MAKKPKVTSQFSLLLASQYSTMKWQNGRGETREIAVDTQNPFRWRISRARLAEPGPFSAYPGYERKIVFIGGGAILQPEGEGTQRLDPFQCFTFSGDSLMHAKVKNPCEDLNLFTLREQAKGTLHIARFQAEEDFQFPLLGEENFVVNLSGEIEYLDPNSDSQGLLSDGNSIRITRPKGINLLNLRTSATASSAICAWITIDL